MKWSVENLKQLQNWATSFNEGDEIVVPDFLALVAINRFRELLTEKQGSVYSNNHFVTEAIEGTLANCHKTI